LLQCSNIEAPSLANFIAIEHPIRFAPPVMSTVRPSMTL